MAQNAENFAPNKVILDEAPTDGVLQVWVKGEAEPRLVLNINGTVEAGNGAAPPAAVAVSSTGNVTAQSGNAAEVIIGDVGPSDTAGVMVSGSIISENQTLHAVEVRADNEDGYGFWAIDGDVRSNALIPGLEVILGLRGPGGEASVSIGGDDSQVYRDNLTGRVTCKSILQGDLEALFSRGGAGQTRVGGVGPGGEAAITFGSGNDVNMYRGGADVLKTDDKLIAAAGLGVGNSDAATVAVGTLARKFEVFDAAGASLGFVPVYTTIT